MILGRKGFLLKEFVVGGANSLTTFFLSLEEYQITFNNQIYLDTYSLSKNHFADIISLFEMTTKKFVYFLVFQGYDSHT